MGAELELRVGHVGGGINLFYIFYSGECKISLYPDGGVSSTNTTSEGIPRVQFTFLRDRAARTDP